MNIFLDDIRFPNEVAVYTKNSVYSYNWVIVRNYEQFVKACKDYWQDIQRISFDHDLGEDEAKELVAKGVSKRKARATKKLCKSGMDCAKWFIEYIDKKRIQLPNILVHSQNPVGRENILSLFASYKKHKQLLIVHENWNEILETHIKEIRLSDFGIQKIITAEEMWLRINNFLLREKKLPDNQTNREKILSAGFDLKTSFRKL